jgi:PAS domain S-box-containing protein
MSKTTILIVEDEGIVAENLHMKLEQLGYAVAGIAVKGEEAIEMALSLKPQLILMDIQLNGQEDGIHAAEMIRAQYDVPVIYLTAHSDPATLARAKLTGPFGYILKPFEVRDLSTQIELALYKHKADLQVREHREWLRVTLTSIGDAVIATDAAGRITFVNPVTESLTGWIAKEVIGQSISKVFRIINEQTGQSMEDPVACVLRECRIIPLANHTALVTKDGSIVPIEDSASPILDANGRVIGVVLVFHDVTQKRLAQEALRESEERYRNLFESIDQGFCIIEMLFDENGEPVDYRFLETNPAFKMHTGLHDAVGKRMKELEPRHEKHWFEIYGRIALTGESERFTNEASHLERRWYDVFAFRIGRPEERKVAILFTDISAHKRAELDLRASKERFELLAQVADRLLRAENPQVIVEDLCRLVMKHIDCQFFFNYLVEEPGKRMHLNAFTGIPKKAADEIRRLDFGVAVCGCVAQNCQRVIAEDIQNSQDLRTLLVKSFGVQAYCCHPLMVHGRLIGTLSFGTKTRPRFTEDEVALMKSVCDQVAVAMQRLITEQELHQVNVSLEQQVAERTLQAETRSKQLQALAVELIEAEERERRRLADHLHDDLQQILAAARMQLDSARQIRDESKLSNVSRLLEESITKSRRLSHELSPPVLQHADLVTALQWIVRYYGEQFGLQVEIVADEARTFESGPLKVFLFRAVQELLFNVVKHAKVKRARIELAGTDGCLALIVSDRGQGIKPDILESGSAPAGLGLLSLRERAQYIGGSLVIESEPGLGSRFTLKIPYNIGKADELQRPANLEPTDAAAERACEIGSGVTRVLFVDDHKVMRQGLINLIGAQPGIDVAGEASNGKEAIDQVRQLKPDVVVMDISMPEMDGIEATRNIKAQWPEVRVIALSMFEDEHIARIMIDAGAEAFVSKTASSTELLKAIYEKNRPVSCRFDGVEKELETFTKK